MSRLDPKFIIKRAYVASSRTNRGGCFRKRCLASCKHEHRTFAAAQRCAKRMQKHEVRPRWWSVDEIVWVRS